MSLGLEDGTRTTKSFWERPEGTTGMLALAGLGALGVFVAGPFILGLLTLLTSIVGQAIMLTIVGSVLFVLLYVLTNKKFQNLMSYMFKSAMRKVTGWFVEIDPIGIMKSYIERMVEKREVMGETRDKLRGQLKVLEERISKNNAAYEKSMALAQVAKERDNRQVLTVQSRQALRMEGLNKESLLPLKVQMEAHLRAANKYYEVTGTVIEDLKNEVEAQEIRRDMILSSHTVMKSAKAIMNGGQDERELFDQAMEFVVEDYGMKLGEIESFIENSKPFVDGLDMQNGVYEAEALKRLTEWENKAESVLLGTQKQQLLEYQTVNSPVYTGIGVPAAQVVDYEAMLRK